MRMMPSRALATPKDVLVIVVLFSASLLLLMAPPLTLASLPLWFYMVPALIAGHMLRFRLFLFAIALTVTVAYPLVGARFALFIPEASVSTLLLAAVMGVRHFTGRGDMMLVGTILIAFGAIPLMVLLNIVWSGMTVPHAMLVAARYAFSALLSVIIAEGFILLVTLSRWQILSPLRQLMAFRPSILQVIEVVIGAAVAISLMVSLMLFWRSWDSIQNDSLEVEAQTRLEKLFVAAEQATLSRLQAASALAHNAAEAIALDTVPSEVITYLDDQNDDTELAGIAIKYPSGQILTAGNLSFEQARQAFAAANAKGWRGVFATHTFYGDALLPTHHYLQVGMPSIMLVHRHELAALRFQFAGVLAAMPQLNIEQTVLTPDGDWSFRLPGGVTTLAKDSERVIWSARALTVPEDQYSSGRSFLSQVNPDTLVTFMPMKALTERFEERLFGLQHFQTTIPYWGVFEQYALIMATTTISSLVGLSVLLALARLLIIFLIAPLHDLTTIFEKWRAYRKGDGNMDAAYRGFDENRLSPLHDIHNLQAGFQSLATDVMQGEHRLSTIAANYDELLRSLPLGVLACDAEGNIHFINDAMSDIALHRQDVIKRIRQYAEHMLMEDRTVAEWQLTFDDRSPSSLLLVVNSRLDDRGVESGLWVICTDLTKQKQTNAQLIQASKLATLGEMSTGMAHELNQPLNVISLASSNLRFATSKNKLSTESVLNKLERIDSAVHRAATIIDHMRAFGRIAGEDLTQFNIGEVVNGACDLLHEQLRIAGIRLNNLVPSDGLYVKGNEIQFEQVLINLISNARDAIAECAVEGEIRIDTDTVGDRVLIRVSDNGPGIPEHVLPHVFEPFFTTKPVGKGTGLGGSISYGIVREMQGDIWASNLERGAQITISLPLFNEEAGDPQAAQEVSL
jgi:signal transduction histidine kinase